MKRIVLLVVGVLLALVVASPMTFAQVGQGAKASGETAELATDWWQGPCPNP